MRTIVILIILVSLTIPAFAQFGNETITITTYYPSPYGVYGTFRIYPRDTEPAIAEEGQLYYDSGVISGQRGLKLYNGTHWVSTNISPDAGSGMPVLYPKVYKTAGTETFTVPENVTRIMVEMWGAGSSGSAYHGTPCRQCPGASGSYVKGVFNVNPGEDYAVTIGAKGEPSFFGIWWAFSGAGGSSTLTGPSISSGSFVAGGGQPGAPASSGLTPCVPYAAGGTFTGGFFGFNGNPGSDSYSGLGASAPLGGKGGSYTTDGEHPGAGGGAYGCGTGGPFATKGADGQVIIYY